MISLEINETDLALILEGLELVSGYCVADISSAKELLEDELSEEEDNKVITIFNDGREKAKYITELVRKLNNVKSN